MIAHLRPRWIPPPPPPPPQSSFHLLTLFFSLQSLSQVSQGSSDRRKPATGLFQVSQIKIGWGCDFQFLYSVSFIPWALIRFLALRCNLVFVEEWMNCWSRLQSATENVYAFIHDASLYRCIWVGLSLWWQETYTSKCPRIFQHSFVCICILFPLSPPNNCNLALSPATRGAVKKKKDKKGWIEICQYLCFNTWIKIFLTFPIYSSLSWSVTVFWLICFRWNVTYKHVLTVKVVSCCYITFCISWTAVSLILVPWLKVKSFYAILNVLNLSTWAMRWSTWLI